MSQENQSFYVQFRERREERRRLDELRARAEMASDRATPEVAQRVVAELESRSFALEETERQELKAFVQGLKGRKEDLLRSERDLEELEFRREIGEIDEVELEIRKESLSLKVRELRRHLERELEEYRSLRTYIEADEDRAAKRAVPPPAVAAAEPPAEEEVSEATMMADALPIRERKVAEEAPAEKPVVPAEELLLAEEPVRPPEELVPPPETIEEPLLAESEIEAPAPVEEAPPREEVGAPGEPSSAPSGSSFPPLVVDEPGLESIVVNRDFFAPPGDGGEDALDDLSQLDVLARSLDEIAARQEAADDELAPLPMAKASREQIRGSDILDGIPSAPAFSDEPLQEDATIRRPPTESQTVMVTQPMLILKGQDGSERASFVVKLGTSTVGRGLDNEVVLDDRAVSRKHATLTLERDGTFRITDLGSENGTYVNGARITDLVLKDGDEVHMGKSTLIFAHGK